MSELEIYLMSSLQNIVDLHNLPNDRPCKCMQCKIARQAIKHAQLQAGNANRWADTLPVRSHYEI